MLLHYNPSSFFFFNDTATTEIYTLSLHDALPIFPRPAVERGELVPLLARFQPPAYAFHLAYPPNRYVSNRLACSSRSEEHTSELQSQSNLVCRLLLEKKKRTRKYDSRHQ